MVKKNVNSHIIQLLEATNSTSDFGGSKMNPNIEEEES